MATNNNQEDKPVIVNGKPAEPINKRKLPPDIDWQAKVKELQEKKK